MSITLTVTAKGQSVASVFGMLAQPGTRRRSIHELNEAAAGGWSGEA